MNKKIATSAMSIFSALAIAGGTTYALLDDSVTATGNTFATGTANLEISLDNAGSPLGYGVTIEGPDFTGILPGESRSYDFWLRNNSTDPIVLDLNADVTTINPASDGAQDIDNALLVKWLCDLNFNDDLSDETATAAFSPRAWLNGGAADIGGLPEGQEMMCQLIGTLPESAGNSVAGESVSFDVIYAADQAPQPSATPVPSASPSATPEASPSPSPEASASPSPLPSASP